MNGQLFEQFTDTIRIVRDGPTSEPGLLGSYDGDWRGDSADGDDMCEPITDQVIEQLSEEAVAAPRPVFNPQAAEILLDAGYRYTSLTNLKVTEVDAFLTQVRQFTEYNGFVLPINNCTRAGFLEALIKQKDGDCFRIETNTKEGETAGIVLSTQERTPEGKINPFGSVFVYCLVVSPEFRGDLRVLVGLVDQILYHAEVIGENGIMNRRVIKASSRASTIMKLLDSRSGQRYLESRGYKLDKPVLDDKNTNALGEEMYYIQLVPIS